MQMGEFLGSNASESETNNENEEKIWKNKESERTNSEEEKVHHLK